MYVSCDYGQWFPNSFDASSYFFWVQCFGLSLILGLIVYCLVLWFSQFSDAILFPHVISVSVYQFHFAELCENGSGDLWRYGRRIRDV